MKRILALLLAAMMVFTVAVPTLAEGEVGDLFIPDQVVEEGIDGEYCASPTPDGSCDIDVLNELSQYISLDDFEEWVYLVFKYCPTGQQTFANAWQNSPADATTKARIQELGNRLAGKIPYSTHKDNILDYLWYCCPRSFHCFTTCSVGLGSSGGQTVVTGFTFTKGYKYDAATYQAMIAAIEAKEHYFLDGLEGNTGLTDLQKVVLLHDRIVNWTEYDYDGYEEKYTNNNPDGMDWASYTMYGTIVRRDSVCQGISQAQMYLGRKLGLTINYCHSSKLNHAWVIVTLNGKRYFMDTTWDDPVADSLGRTKHQYLLCSNSKFGHDNTDKPAKIPTAADIDYERTCTDTTYDNAFWRDMKYASIQLVNNDYVTDGVYYFNQSTKNIMRWVDGNDATGANDTAIYNTGDTYTYTTSDGERLFFSQGRTVYEWDFANSKAVALWTLPASLGSSYKICGIQYDNRVSADFKTDAEMSAMTEAERAPYDYMRYNGDTGSKLWVRAATSATATSSNATQFNNIFEAEIGEPLQTYTVSVTNGTATPSTALPGERITLKANAAETGMVFDKWVVDTGSAAITLSSTTGTSPTFTMPYGNVSVTATYKTKPTTMPETGYNYLVNGDFAVENVSAADFGWKRDGGAAVSVSNGVASVTNGNQTLYGMYERIAFVPGHNYTITGHISDLAGELKLFLKGGSESAYVKALSNGDFTYTFDATSDMDRILFGGYKTTYKISNVTLTDNTGGGVTPSSSSSQSATTTTQSSGGGGTVSGNLIVNGDFSNGTTGWTISPSGIASVSNGQLVISGNPSSDFQAKATFTQVIGDASTAKTYTLRFEIGEASGVTVKVHNKEGDGSGARQTYTASGTYTFEVASGITSNAANYKQEFSIYISGTKYQNIAAVLDNFVLVEGSSIPETSETQPSETQPSETQPTPVTETYNIAVNNGTANKEAAEAGATITLIAGEAATGYTFDQWTSEDGVEFADATLPQTTFVMPAYGVTVTAQFKKIDYTVTVINGAVSPEIAGIGDTVTLVADEPAEGMQFDKWIVRSGSTPVTFANAASFSTTFTMPAGNVSVEATYSEVQQESDLPAPQGVTATATATGITVSWNAVSGASGYRVYKKVNGAWNTVKTLNDGAATSLAVTDLNAGEATTFTVQAFATTGSETVWSAKSADVTATATFGAPDVGTASADNLGIKVTWAKVSGASGYRIYRRTVENQTLSSWKTVTTIANNNTLTYTDYEIVIGAEYAYTVQAYTGSGDSLKWSTYDPVGMRGRVNLSQPVLGTATKVSTGATITWNAVSGATGYRLYRWNGSAWKTVKTVLGASTVSYTDTNSKAVAGAKYTVQAFHAHDGVVTWGEPNTTGVTVAGGDTPTPPTPTILGSEDIDLVTLTYFDEACTEYGVSFHSFAAMTSPKIQIVQGVASSASDFASAREIAVTDNYTKQLNEFKDYNKTDYSYYYNWSERSSITTQITTYVHQGVIDGLNYNTTYSYRVGDASSGVWSGIYTFTTRPQTIGDFSLIYTADTQPENSDSKGWRGVSTIFQKALATAPNAAFFVSGGDFVYCSDDGMSSISPWRNTINGSNNLFGGDAYFAEHPWFVANGNHDNNYVQWFFNNDTTNTSSDYYSYDYGDVHFIVLDSGHNGNLDSTQINWLRSDLQATTKKFKVVFLHWPFYCHSERDLDDATSRSAIDIFEQYNVDFVISAHVNEDYYTTYPLKDDAIGTSSYTTEGDIKYFQGGNGPIYLQNAGSGLNGELEQLGELGVMYRGKNDGGQTCSYPNLMLHEAMAGYESSYLVMKVEGNKLSVNRYYLDASGNSQRYSVGQVGVIKN